MQHGIVDHRRHDQGVRRTARAGPWYTIALWTAWCAVSLWAGLLAAIVGVVLLLAADTALHAPDE